jgi:ferritin-like metal-binding protein YciE
MSSEGKGMQQQLIAWLDDAHAMERGLVPILHNHAAHFRAAMPEIASRILQHAEETQVHAERLAQCLMVLNANPSATKSTLSSIMGTVEGAATSLFGDSIVKDALAEYGSEQFEVGCYTTLITAARHCGYPEIADVCESNLTEDLEMAAWIVEQLPAIAAHHCRAVEVG